MTIRCTERSRIPDRIYRKQSSHVISRSRDDRLVAVIVRGSRSRARGRRARISPSSRGAANEKCRTRTTRVAAAAELSSRCTPGCASRRQGPPGSSVAGSRSDPQALAPEETRSLQRSGFEHRDVDTRERRLPGAHQSGRHRQWRQRQERGSPSSSAAAPPSSSFDENGDDRDCAAAQQ